MHERSANHKICFFDWKELERKFTSNSTLDKDFQRVLKNEKQKWREILLRIVHCIKYLALQNQALRGHRESLTDPANAGNFLELIKLISVFDLFMKGHLESITASPDSIGYLSHQVQNKFLSLTKRES